jgi:filamentous hemagglutinin
MTSDYMKTSDHAKSHAPDQSRAQKGIDRIGQQLASTDATPIHDRTPGGASDVSKAQQGIDQLEDQLIEPIPNSEQSNSSNDVVHIHGHEEIYFDELKPNTIYEKDAYRFHTDEHGRPSLISGYLKLEKGTRSEQQTIVGKLGLEYDEGGHLIGARFNGPSDGFNLVPQNMNLNRGAWKVMENDWERHLKAHERVEVAISPVYLDSSRRPIGFDVLYQIEDEYYTKSFYNESAKEE